MDLGKFQVSEPDLQKNTSLCSKWKLVLWTGSKPGTNNCGAENWGLIFIEQTEKKQ